MGGGGDSTYPPPTPSKLRLRKIWCNCPILGKKGTFFFDIVWEQFGAEIQLFPFVPDLEKNCLRNPNLCSFFCVSFVPYIVVQLHHVLLVPN